MVNGHYATTDKHIIKGAYASLLVVFFFLETDKKNGGHFPDINLRGFRENNLHDKMGQDH